MVHLMLAFSRHLSAELSPT